jgi:hypothetical protein
MSARALFSSLRTRGFKSNNISSNDTQTEYADMSGKDEAGKKPDKAGLGEPLYQPEGGKAQVEYAHHLPAPPL